MIRQLQQVNPHCVNSTTLTRRPPMNPNYLLKKTKTKIPCMALGYFKGLNVTQMLQFRPSDKMEPRRGAVSLHPAGVLTPHSSVVTEPD